MARIALFATSCLVLLLLHVLPSRAGILDFGSSCTKEQIHNYYFGQRRPYDRLLYMDRPKFESKFMRVRSEDLTYPVKGQPSGGVISYIEVRDLKNDGTGGCVYIKNGGIGSTFVMLKMKTQRNHGMYFSVEIWGH